MSEWMELLDSTMTTKPDVVPDGFYTSGQLCEMLGKSQAQTFKRIRFLMDEGRIERKKFRINCQKYIRCVGHYRIKK